ncbi:MAG: WecB/TagA/CpsF family glycosyltransferase [Anaerolineae bacterium]
MEPPEAVWILGVRVHRLRLEEVTLWAEAAAGGGKPRHVVTVNPEFIVHARGDEVFRQVLNGADLALADGYGVVWASRVLGCSLPERVAGVDTMQRLCAWAAEVGWPVFLLGASPGVAERAAAVLVQEHPALQVAGCHAGSPRPEEEEGIVERVRGSGAKILFVAYGAPRQDLWIARNLPRLGVSIAVGVGGSFDFIAGIVPRAPEWMQRWGLEWLYRLARQPWRWRRMLALPRFAGLVLWERCRRGRGVAHVH